MTHAPWHILLVLLAYLLSACSSTPKYQQAMDFSVNDYQQNITRRDSGQKIILSSKNALHSNPGISESEFNDNYVRAIIDTRNGKVSYQVINIVQYQAPSWLFYDLAKYVTQEGLNEVALKVVDHQVIECPIFSDCIYQETTSFKIAESIIKKGAERFQAGTQAGIKYRLIPKTGDAYTGIIFAQELIAMYNVVNSVHKRKK